jgi:RNA polymerase sigma-70 factor (ECF subfamily)
MAELYDRYATRVYSIVRAIIWDAGSAEDVTQDVFLRIWNRAHLLDRSRGVPLAWIRTLARNIAIDALRSKRWGVLFPLAESTDGGHRDSETSHVNRIRIERALDGLDSNQRSVIEMAYFEGLSQTEIARKTGRPLGTVKTWVRGALIALRKPNVSGAFDA